MSALLISSVGKGVAMCSMPGRDPSPNQIPAAPDTKRLGVGGEGDGQRGSRVGSRRLLWV